VSGSDGSSRRTARTASADSEVRPGPRLPTLRPCSVKIREAAPEVLSTVSLPTMRLRTFRFKRCALADLLGIHVTTAIRWASLVKRDWLSYLNAPR
jgi:hypothetical protein